MLGPVISQFGPNLVCDPLGGFDRFLESRNIGDGHLTYAGMQMLYYRHCGSIVL